MAIVFFPKLGSSADTPTTDNGRMRLTRKDCEFLEQGGLLPKHYELIDGDIFSKMGQSIFHMRAVSLVIAYILAHFSKQQYFKQGTMEVREEDRETNRPEPDVYVTREPWLTDELPTGKDTALAIEVCYSTEGNDFGSKLALYARAGVEEYWVVDIKKRRVVVHRQPVGDKWQGEENFAEDDSIAPLCAPQAVVTVRNLLPSQSRRQRTLCLKTNCLTKPASVLPAPTATF